MIRVLKEKINNFNIRKKVKRCGVNLKTIGRQEILSKNIYLGNNVELHPGVMIFGKGKISIGDNTVIGKDVIIFSNKEVIIGKNVLIAAQTYIIDSDHNFEARSLIREQNLTSESVFIRDDVWIGAGVKILKGIVIGEGAVIGAAAVVTKSIEPYSVNVGIPSYQIGKRK